MQRTHLSSVLNGSDIQVIETSAEMLPGEWHLDPVIDLTRPGQPRVWVVSADPTVSPISFERIGSIIWMGGFNGLPNDRGFEIGRPFATLIDALGFLCGMIEVLRARRIMAAQDWLSLPSRDPSPGITPQTFLNL